MTVKQFTHNDIKDALHKLSDKASSKYPYINSGGCGFFAAEVVSMLKKADVACEIVTPAYDPTMVPKFIRKNYKNKLHNVWDWSDKGLDRSHMVVRLILNDSVYTYDSDGLRGGGNEFGRYKCDYPFGHGLNHKECRKMVKTPDAWNTTFPREDMPAIKRLINSHLEKFKIES